MGLQKLWLQPGKHTATQGEQTDGVSVGVSEMLQQLSGTVRICFLFEDASRA